MNKSIFSLLILGFLFGAIALPAQADLSKDEIKKWKNIAKDYRKNPAKLKELTEEHRDFRRQVDEMSDDVKRLEAQNNTKDGRIQALEDEVGSLQSQLSAAKASFEEFSDPQGDPEVLPMGVLFRVQIGAYQKSKIPGDLDTQQDMALEEQEDLQKIVLGQFRNYGDAENLRDRLKAMGVADAWIVSYRDGNRISIEEALGQ
jgi:chromosome segregation ATPase